jgi:hypothetical protein
MHATVREFVSGKGKQLPSQSVTKYRLACETKLRTAVDIGCDVMMAHFFVGGLLSLDDIIMSPQEHLTQLRLVLELLEKHTLHVKLTFSSNQN